MKRLAIAGAAFVAAGLALAGCSSSSGSGSTAGSSSSSPFRVLVATGTSGPTASESQMALKQFQGTAAELNKSGGVDGRKIVVSSVNTQGDPTTAVTVLQQALASGPKPDLVFAGLSSGETSALIPILNRDKILNTFSANDDSLNDPQRYPYSFGFTLSSTDSQLGIAAYVKQNHITKVSTLLPNDDFGQGEATALATVLKGEGVSLSQTSYDDTATDYTVQWQTAISSSPQVVLADCFGSDCAPLLASRAKANADSIPVILGVGAASTGEGPESFASGSSLDNASIELYSYQVYRAASQQTSAFSAMLGNISPADGSIVPGVLPADQLRGVALACEKAKSSNVSDIVQQMYQLTAQPADSWATGWNVKFSPSSHFIQTTAAQNDTVVVKVGPLVNGMFKSGS
jgi:branched-chain amino acid transport system substrate-binding protein